MTMIVLIIIRNIMNVHVIIKIYLLIKNSAITYFYSYCMQNGNFELKKVMKKEVISLVRAK